MVLLAVPAGLAQEEARPEPAMVKVVYQGHRSYPGFTRLVFDTGGFRPDGFRINYDQDEKRLVFYPTEGLLAFSFVPVRGVDSVVSDVDFVESDDQRRGVVVHLGQASAGLRISYLAGPYRLVLDIYKKTKDEPLMAYSRRVRTVAIDPGHGGRQAGAGAGGKLTEKDLALDVAVRLRKLLTRQGYGVVLTRTADQDLPADTRAGIANAAHADLFISIHVSGTFGAAGGGLNIFTVDDGGLCEASPAPKGALLWSDQQAPYLPESIRLARGLFVSLGGLYDGAKPRLISGGLAGFSGLAMPAALVELGDIKDRAGAMNEDSFREKAAALLAKGINDYARGVNK